MLPSPRLPVELLSIVLSHLPIDTLLALGLHSTFFRSLLVSPLVHPWDLPLHLVLQSPTPYPPQLAQLPTLDLLPPRVLLDLLVRARPEWILYELEGPVGLGEPAWEQVCRARFLPSWYAAGQGSSWRSLFLRTLNRIAHRQRTSCTTDEPFVRWIQLDRKGTATVNRLRTAGFDPVEVYRSLASAQTHYASPTPSVRPLVQLTDVSLFAIGVLDRPSSIFSNRNAGDLLRPPGLVRQANDLAAAVVVGRPTTTAIGRTADTKGRGGLWGNDDDGRPPHKGKARERAFSEGGGGGGGGDPTAALLQRSTPPHHGPPPPPPPPPGQRSVVWQTTPPLPPAATAGAVAAAAAAAAGGGGASSSSGRSIGGPLATSFFASAQRTGSSVIGGGRARARSNERPRIDEGLPTMKPTTTADSGTGMGTGTGTGPIHPPGSSSSSSGGGGGGGSGGGGGPARRAFGIPLSRTLSGGGTGRSFASSWASSSSSSVAPTFPSPSASSFASTGAGGGSGGGGGPSSWLTTASSSLGNMFRSATAGSSGSGGSGGGGYGHGHGHHSSLPDHTLWNSGPPLVFGHPSAASSSSATAAAGPSPSQQQQQQQHVDGTGPGGSGSGGPQALHWIASAAPPPMLLDLSPAPSSRTSPRTRTIRLPSFGGGGGGGGGGGPSFSSSSSSALSLRSAESSGRSTPHAAAAAAAVTATARPGTPVRPSMAATTAGGSTSSLPGGGRAASTTTTTSPPTTTSLTFVTPVVAPPHVRIDAPSSSAAAAAAVVEVGLAGLALSPAQPTGRSAANVGTGRRPPPPTLTTTGSISSPSPTDPLLASSASRPSPGVSGLPTPRGAYPVLREPRPTDAFRLYPNYTPGGADVRMRPDGRLGPPPPPPPSSPALASGSLAAGGDGRGRDDGGIDDDAEEEEEEEAADDEGGGWESVEWPEVEGTKTWVGPMMIVAVLNAPPAPSSGTSQQQQQQQQQEEEEAATAWSFPSSPSADPSLHLHSLLSAHAAGGRRNLPPGSARSPPAFTSFDAADLWAIAPWMRDGVAGEGRGVKGSRVWGGVGFLREEGRGSF